MAVRTCPHCMKIVPAGTVAAHSDGFECPHCHTRLEVLGGSRGLAIWAGLIAGFLVWYYTRSLDGNTSWVLPEFYAIFTAGVIAAVILMFTAELRTAPDLPVMAAAPTHGHAPSHGAAHH